MKVLLSVEGQAEEAFVMRVLQPHFVAHDLWLQPVLIKTRRDPNAPAHKGGCAPYKRVKKELQNLLGDSSAIAVTTMYDFYALPGDFPGLTHLREACPHFGEWIVWLESLSNL